ncbi:hypothetical protein CAP36_00985 [Chitinophagaceae bacterium IBVUCB2]|nr:hypothetical protein CAP36_00985 [Chitinophagaceae bacterium IBVUCB2]
MKKIIALSFLSFVSLVVISSCGSGEEKKEVIVVPSSTQRVIIEKEPAKKTTTVTLDKNGVKVEGKKVDVVIKKN